MHSFNSELIAMHKQHSKAQFVPSIKLLFISIVIMCFYSTILVHVVDTTKSISFVAVCEKIKEKGDQEQC